MIGWCLQALFGHFDKYDSNFYGGDTKNGSEYLFGFKMVWYSDGCLIHSNSRLILHAWYSNGPNHLHKMLIFTAMMSDFSMVWTLLTSSFGIMKIKELKFI